jgi:hypothetical protein
LTFLCSRAALSTVLENTNNAMTRLKGELEAKEATIRHGKKELARVRLSIELHF